MGYAEKLEQIEAEIETMADADDFPEDLVEKVIEELEAEALESALEYFHNSYSSDIEKGEIQSACSEAMLEQLLAERLTPEEKEEGKRIRAQERMVGLKQEIARIEQEVKKAEAGVAEATRRNKPKMLVHETYRLKNLNHHLSAAQTKLAELARVGLAAETAANPLWAPARIEELAAVLTSNVTDPDGKTDQLLFAMIHKDGSGRVVFPSMTEWIFVRRG